MNHWGHRVAGIVSALALALPDWARVQSSTTPPPAPWPGPAGAWLYAEGEDFSPVGEGWTVATQAAQLVSPGSQGPAVAQDAGLSGSGPGEGTASLTAAVPAAGGYRLHVRFAQASGGLPDHAGPFELRVAQGGKQLLAFVFGADAVPGQPGVMVLRWQRAERLALPVPPGELAAEGADAELTLDEPQVPMDVALAAGPVTFTVAKVGPATCHAPARLLDCLLLTQDPAYVPDYRDFGPQLYARAEFLTLDGESGYLLADADHLRGPSYHRSFRIGRDGALPGYQIGPKDFLLPGQAGAWGNLSRVFDHDADSIVSYGAHLGYHRPSREAEYRLDFASAPTEAAVFQRIERRGPGQGLRVRIPWQADPAHLPQADFWYAERRLAWLRTLPAPAFGRRPTRFALSAALVQRHGAFSPACLAAETEIAAWLGLNTVEGVPTAEDVAAGLLYGTTGASVWHMGPAGFIAPDLPTIRARVAADAQGIAALGERAQRLLHTNLMDEASPLSLPQLIAIPEQHAAFTAWVRQRGYRAWDDDAQRLLDGEQAPLELTADGARFPRRYYYSQQFRAWTIVDFFRQATAIVRQHYPPNAGTTQNFSDGPVWGSSLYAQGNDYWLWFRERALDVAHSEDWTNQGATPQLAGWNGALLRSATKYHGQPLHMYVIASGRPPEVVKLKSYAHLAQGARYLAFYAYSPEYGWHEGGWGTTEAMYPALAELSREIGAAEEALMAARPRPARVAILYARPTDVWAMAEPLDNSQGVERMMTWLALQHAQVQNDVLVDQDVVEGRLAPYRVAYLHGLQVEEQMVAPLAAWVQAGGTLVLNPGAASRNEFNAPLPALDQALGLQRQEPAHPAHVFHATAYISQMMKPLEPVTLREPAGQVDALVWTQRFTPGPGAEVLANFADGTPAAVVQPAGQGRVVLLGYMPGLAYLRGAWLAYQQAWEAHRAAPVAPPPAPLPTAWDAALRTTLAAPALRFAGPPPVTASAPLVEATLLEGDQGWAVPLANWSLQPLDALTVTVRLGRPCREARSSRLGLLPTTAAPDGAITVTLPLGTTDLLYGR